ncbi:hypothetical protein M0R45_028421 [Rubus argutus]|uniref:Uncharacterized protein n=1 Tax=Rubus argutus TaxID=59490 RepID=A0AAW1W4M4_RUBAR
MTVQKSKPSNKNIRMAVESKFMQVPVTYGLFSSECSIEKPSYTVEVLFRPSVSLKTDVGHETPISPSNKKGFYDNLCHTSTSAPPLSTPVVGNKIKPVLPLIILTSDTKTLEAFERFQKKLAEVEDGIITLSMNNDKKLKNQVVPANVHFILVKVKLLARGFPVLNSVST